MFGRSMAPAPAPDGARAGALLGLAPAPAGLALEPLTRLWQPWRGKRFDARRGRGTNLLERSAFAPLRAASGRRHFHWWPEDHELFQALPFATRLAPGLLDEAQDVLRIDYDLPENQPLLRRIVDELVEVEPGVLLGQALVRLPGRHLRAAWFGLW
jgi:hypothetical protein